MIGVVSIMSAMRTILPFYGALMLVLVTYAPDFSMFLPNLIWRK